MLMVRDELKDKKNQAVGRYYHKNDQMANFSLAIFDGVTS